ncbi:MAG: hypothetical protein IJW54_05980 [Clostridia bacterium]|nr:hypothetical protein [Clostridia bacterium]
MKKSLKSISFWLVILTSFLSLVFLGIFDWASNAYITDPYFPESAVWTIHYFEVFFTSVSLFACYGIIIYSYARYTPDKAKFSFVYLGINLSLYLIYMIVNLCIRSTVFDIVALYNAICAFFGKIVIEQFLPSLLVAFVTYKLTRNGIQRVTSFISMKNSIQKAMITSTLVVFGINIFFLLAFDMFPFLFENSFYITFNDFIGRVLVPICEKLIASIILQYSVYMLMYFICNKYGETNGLTQKNNK